MFSGKTLLIFGGGFLQLSIIERCNSLGINTVVIDPFEKAPGKETANYFEVIGGQDFDGTCKIIAKYKVDGIITSATDKPLVMMARIAKEYNLPFYSIETAQNCTDKFQMKEVFQENGIRCADGYLVTAASEILSFPAIIKPLDNSGSRGVYLCSTPDEAINLISEAFRHTHLANILVESYIEGNEYSVESLHFEDHAEVLQITEKITTEFPANVELGHMAPAVVTTDETEAIKSTIQSIHKAFSFKNCAAHTELKIHNGIITVIETSPRLGGDFITSDLVPLSTGINIEDQLIAIALGASMTLPQRENRHSGAFFFQFDAGKRIKKLPTLEALDSLQTLKKIAISIEPDEEIKSIQSSLDRHGYFVLQAQNRNELIRDRNRVYTFVYSNTEYY